MTELKVETLNRGRDERVKTLVLDDGTRLVPYETELVNKHGESETFEMIRDREMKWHCWGPHNVTVTLTKSSIQSMFDDNELEIETE